MPKYKILCEKLFWFPSVAITTTDLKPSGYPLRVNFFGKFRSDSFRICLFSSRI